MTINLNIDYIRNRFVITLHITYIYLLILFNVFYDIHQIYWFILLCVISNDCDSSTKWIGFSIIYEIYFIFNSIYHENILSVIVKLNIFHFLMIFGHLYDIYCIYKKLEYTQSNIIKEIPIKLIISISIHISCIVVILIFFTDGINIFCDIINDFLSDFLNMIQLPNNTDEIHYFTYSLYMAFMLSMYSTCFLSILTSLFNINFHIRYVDKIDLSRPISYIIFKDANYWNNFIVRYLSNVVMFLITVFLILFIILFLIIYPHSTAWFLSIISIWISQIILINIMRYLFCKCWLSTNEQIIHPKIFAFLDFIWSIFLIDIQDTANNMIMKSIFHIVFIQLIDITDKSNNYCSIMRHRIEYSKQILQEEEKEDISHINPIEVEEKFIKMEKNTKLYEIEIR